MSINEFCNYYKTNFYKIAVIISSQYSCEIEKQLNSYDILDNIFSYEEINYIIDMQFYKFADFMTEQAELSLKGALSNLYLGILESLKRNKLFGEESYFIYSIPKTGTTSLISTLRYKYRKNALRIHFIGDSTCKKFLSISYSKKIKSFFTTNKYITLVREPLIRNISFIFQCNREYFSEMEEPNCKDMQNIFNITFIHKNIANDFFTKPNLKIYNDNHYFDHEEWFDNEMRVNLGLDIFKYPFDKEKGYTIIKLEGGGDF